MTTANTRIAIVLAGFLALGLGPVAEQASAEQPAGFSQAELDQMLAPIALYPDTVLSHVLIAATYPLEVVQAARWSRANPGYSGEYAVEAVEHMPWDPSVMALVAFPELLQRMDDDLVWTQRLGDAFLVQEYQVLDTVQYLRDEAYAAGHLRSNEYVRVVREPAYIYIEPAVTRVVYVPYYDPRVVYGSWRHSAYPPVYWNHPRGYGYRAGSGLSFYWSSGHRVQSAFFFSSFHWSSRKVVVHNHYRYGHRDHGKYAHGGHKFSSGRDVAYYKNAKHWKHNPEHRRGVAYRRGIDERHATRASYRSEAADSRRDLLRQRSRSAAASTQRSTANADSTSARNRQVSERAMQSRNALQRSNRSAREIARSEAPTARSRSNNAPASRSYSQQSSSPRSGSRAVGRATPDRASATDRASTRRELTRGRTSPGQAAPRTSSRESSTSPARSTQARSAPSRSSTRAALQSSSRSRAAAPNNRAAQARSRPSGGSVQSQSRGSRSTAPTRSPQRSTNRSKQTAAPSRSTRVEAPARARSAGNSSRAEALRDRGRKRDQ